MTQSVGPRDIVAFQDSRGAMLGLAYRMLGSRSDADDVLQDVFLKWQAANREAIQEPAAWLVTACTRRCIDVLRSAARSRTDYVGPWLPEPMDAAALDEPAALSDSLETAFLTLLERVTPRERAAFLLHEVFDMPHTEVAVALGLTPGASRKLVSRARAAISADAPRVVVEPGRHRALLESFERAIRTDDMAEFGAFLSRDVRLTADSGGKAPSVGAICGSEEALAFLAQARAWWPHYVWRPVDLARSRGFLMSDGYTPVVLIWFASTDGQEVSDIFVLRNPDKLAALVHYLGAPPCAG
ncbi:sigma-70 family RNA polymerase sigma factor [Brevundimonas sp. SL161]|uniref:sigma-70 family RNA polymerase sigma factor n=1 Tax=Brevundimonas sp. SL161 TaxID=2804613 RepID=UPI003CE9E45B